MFLSSRIISKEIQRYSYKNNFYGNNATEYVKSMDVSLNGDFGKKVGEKDKEKFPNTISGNFSTKQSYALNNTFVGMDECVEIGKSYFVEKDITILQKYLDSGFSYSLANKSATTIVSEYGTHVLLDITVAGKLSLLYRSEVVKTTKETTAKAGFAAVLGGFGLSGSGSTNTQLVNNNTNAYLVAKSNGGTKSISESWDFASGPLKSISTSDWSSSVDFTNGVLLKIQTAVPIYDRELELLTPMHRYWSSSLSDHMYKTSMDNNSRYVYEGVQFYAYRGNIKY